MRSKQQIRVWKGASRAAAAPFTRRLVVMVKEPRAGRVKTRLAREIGAVAATQFYRHAAGAVIGRLAMARGWQTWLSVAPDVAVAGRSWERRVPRRAQGGGDLGRRMQGIMEWPGAGPIVIVGTDIPAIEPQHIRAAFRLLGKNDAVLGPTPDGGYWLVGLRRCPRVLSPFGSVRWSSVDALADTAANLSGHTIGRAALLCDVDDRAEWENVRGWSGRRVLSHALRQAKQESGGSGDDGS